MNAVEVVNWKGASCELKMAAKMENKRKKWILNCIECVFVRRLEFILGICFISPGFSSVISMREMCEFSQIFSILTLHSTYYTLALSTSLL